MGLLDMGAPAPTGSAGASMGGLLGGAGPAPQQQGQGETPEMIAAWTGLIQQLASSPTPQAAQQIAAQLTRMGDPESMKFAQVLQQVQQQAPDTLPQLAQAMAQQVKGG